MSQRPSTAKPGVSHSADNATSITVSKGGDSLGLTVYPDKPAVFASNHEHADTIGGGAKSPQQPGLAIEVQGTQSQTELYAEGEGDEPELVAEKENEEKLSDETDDGWITQDVEKHILDELEKLEEISTTDLRKAIEDAIVDAVRITRNTWKLGNEVIQRKITELQKEVGELKKSNQDGSNTETISQDDLQKFKKKLTDIVKKVFQQEPSGPSSKANSAFEQQHDNTLQPANPAQTTTVASTPTPTTPRTPTPTLTTAAPTTPRPSTPQSLSRTMNLSSLVNNGLNTASTFQPIGGGNSEYETGLKKLLEGFSREAQSPGSIPESGTYNSLITTLFDDSLKTRRDRIVPPSITDDQLKQGSLANGRRSPPPSPSRSSGSSSPR